MPDFHNQKTEHLIKVDLIGKKHRSNNEREKQPRKILAGTSKLVIDIVDTVHFFPKLAEALKMNAGAFLRQVGRKPFPAVFKMMHSGKRGPNLRAWSPVHDIGTFLQ